MKYLLLLVLFFSADGFSQRIDANKSQDTVKRKSLRQSTKVSKVATIDQYRIITLNRDTTYVDTSLTIQSEYRFNYLRRDIFGLLPFSNEGQTYTVLDYGHYSNSAFPEMGYKAKHIAWMQASDIRYYSVATPFTELYFKSVMEQGQNVDAFLTANVSPQFNFSIAYKGLRSLGKYINQLSSTGHFRLTASYATKDQRYIANAHYVSQDFLNEENGGLLNPSDFESEDERFDNRARLDVYLRDAESFIRGKRFFIDHRFRVNPSDAQNNLNITHRFNYERKLFEYSQTTLGTAITVDTIRQRFGESYVTTSLKDQSHYNRMYNRVGAEYENKTLGKFQFFAEDFRYNFYFDRILILNNEVNAGLLSDEIQTAGGQYEYRKGKWNASLLFSNSISNQSLSTIDARATFTLNERNSLSFQYEKLNKLPDHLYNLNQSSYVNYNWVNDFKNEKINNIHIEAKTQWLTASAQISSMRDLLYFSNDDETGLYQLISPKQYGQTINYLSIRAGREIKWWKLALDNTVLYQKVDQPDDIVNVPEITTRNTLYFTDYFFKKALFLQTGVTLNYFSKYYMNDYNPVIAESFVQNQKQIGNFPMLDFFVNARIRQTRIFLKFEHFNSAWTGNKFLTAPNYPYRDFVIRFGLEWNFFQ